MYSRIQVFGYSGHRVYSGIQVFGYSSIQVFMYSCIRVFRYSGIQVDILAKVGAKVVSDPPYLEARKTRG